MLVKADSHRRRTPSAPVAASASRSVLSAGGGAASVAAGSAASRAAAKAACTSRFISFVIADTSDVRTETCSLACEMASAASTSSATSESAKDDVAKSESFGAKALQPWLPERLATSAWIAETEGV
eukprot:3006131-Prymnesium_polylepis.1